MKIKNILLLALPVALILTGCNNEENKTVNSLENVQNILDKVIKSNNYSVSYLYGNEVYDTYHNSNYFFDTYSNSGYVLLDDGYSYGFNVYDDKAMLKTPFASDEATDFNKTFNSLSIDIETFFESDDLYVSESFKTCESFAKMVSIDAGSLEDRAISYTKVFIEEDLLNFGLFDEKDELMVQAYIYDVDETEFSPISAFLKNGITPEGIIDSTKPLEAIFGVGSFSGNVKVKNIKGSSTSSFVINDNYFYEYSKDFKNGTGWIRLHDDSVHEFTITNNELNVIYDYAVIYDSEGTGYDLTSELYDELFGLGRVDYSKFEKINDSTYLSRDYFNVSSFANYLAIYNTDVDAMKVIINDDNVMVNFYNGSSLYSEVSITSLNSISVPVIDKYILDKSLPALANGKNNEQLVEFSKDLGDNYMISSYDSELSFQFYDEVISTENGRLEKWSSSYFFDRSNMFIKLNDRYYRYYLNGDSEIELNYQESISIDEYRANYTFDGIDFSKFIGLGNDLNGNPRFYLSSSRVADIFNNMISESKVYPLTETYLTLLSDGTLKVELYGINSVGETERRVDSIIKGINVQTNELLDTYIENFDETTLTRNNTELKSRIKEVLNSMNFSLQPLSNGVDEYNNDDRDFYVGDTYYSGYYKDGIITGSVSKYLYEYDSDHQDEDGSTTYLYVSDTPKAELTLKEWCRLSYFDDDVLDTFVVDGTDKYSSFDSESIAYLGVFMGMNQSTYRWINKISITLEDDKILLSTYSRDSIVADEVTTNKYEYVTFGEAEILNIGNTKLPDSAIIPANIK